MAYICGEDVSDDSAAYNQHSIVVWLVGVGRNRTLMTKDRQHFRALFGWVRLVVTYPKLPATEVSGSSEESRNLTSKVN